MKNVYKLNDQGVMFKFDESSERYNEMSLEDFLDYYDKKLIIYYNKYIKEFIFYIDDGRYVLELSEGLKNQLVKGIPNKYLELLTKKAEDGRYINKMVKETGEYPKDERDIELYHKYLEKLYNDTNAKVTSLKVKLSILPTLSIGVLIGIGCYVAGNGGSASEVIANVALTSLCLGGLNLTPVAMLDPDYSFEKNYLQQTRQRLEKFEKYMDDRKKDFSINKSQNSIDLELAKTINEMLQLFEEIENLPEDKRESLSTKIKNLIVSYKAEFCSIAIKNDPGTEVFNKEFATLQMNTQDKTNKLSNTIKTEINNSKKLLSTGELQVATTSI